MLRPYQKEMHGAIGNHYDTGTHQQVISAATGTGKTRVFSELPMYLKSRLPGQMLVLAHREELIDQGIDKMKEANPSLRVTKEMAGFVADVNADVIVGSVATLGRKGSTRAERFPWQNIDKVVTDEAHHATSDTYTNIYELADVLRPDTHKLHVGFTATPQRADGKALAKVFRKIVYEYSLRRAIEEGYLVEPVGIRVQTQTSLAEVKSSGGDFSTQSLADAINTPERNQLVVKAWLDYGRGRQTIGFTANIQHAVDLAAMFQHYGVKAEALWGDDPERKDKIARHQNRETTVLLNCGVLTEGYDDPQISCILLARPTKSGVLYAQMVGRGTRLFEGKTDCIVIDVVDSTTKNSLLTLPTLMGLNAKLNLKGQGILQAVRRMEEAQKDFPHLNFADLPAIDMLDSYIERVNLFEVKFDTEVEANSELSWYPNPTGGYVMLLPNNDKLSICQNILDGYEIRGNIRNKKYRGERGTIGEAFSAADALIQNVCPDVLKIVRREEAWHREPPTKPQLWRLKRLYPGKVFPNDLDKGTASQLLSAAKAGGKWAS